MNSQMSIMTPVNDVEVQLAGLDLDRLRHPILKMGIIGRRSPAAPHRTASRRGGSTGSSGSSTSGTAGLSRRRYCGGCCRSDYLLGRPHTSGSPETGVGGEWP